MKKIINFICALGAIVFLSNLTTYAQGRSSGRGPAVTGSHAPDSDHGNTDHGKTADNSKDADHRNAHSDATDTHKDTSVADQIQHNSGLNAKVQSLLPPNTDLQTAAAGFKNQGQFIAALHVAKNLNIPFADLQAKMTGTNPESLGKAIHDLKPGISEQEAKKDASIAEKEAKLTVTVTTKPVS
jgi:hypothetical protein